MYPDDKLTTWCLSATWIFIKSSFEIVRVLPNHSGLDLLYEELLAAIGVV